MFNILYVSEFCSDNVFNRILESSKIKPSQSGQKFHKLVIEGLSNQSEKCKVETISKFPINFKSNKKIFWFNKNIRIGNVRINYAPIVNLPIISSILLIIYSFFKTLLWSREKNHNVVICDVLSLSITIGTLYASKIRGINCIGIVTDLPFYQEVSSKKSEIIKKILYHFISKYDAYILITERMNSVVNKKNKPYCIIEGLVDIRMAEIEPVIKKALPRNIMYTGALLEIFGVKLLIEAFMRIKNDDVVLSIYGAGPMEHEIKEYCKLDQRIRFYGVVSNEAVVKEQLCATLLVNTRLTTLDFSEYSFPSKNIEYMVSGTPVISTSLPGIPDEYFEYLYVFEDESIDGISATLNHILNLPPNEIQLKGVSARNFVLEFKNNNAQALKILNFINVRMNNGRI